MQRIQLVWSDIIRKKLPNFIKNCKKSWQICQCFGHDRAILRVAEI